ncbi:MAG: alkyl hydroperoxide reductase subunit AhpC, partial [Myxococcota bacterium]
MQPELEKLGVRVVALSKDTVAECAVHKERDREDRQHKATLRCIRDIHPSRRAVRTPHRGPSRA